MDRTFFGRSLMLSLLKKRVIGLKDGYRQNIAVLGNQYSGKTSVLHHFMANLDEPEVTCINLDLENKDIHYFFNKLVGSLLYNFSKNCHLPLKEAMSELMEVVRERIPQTVQVIRQIQKDIDKGKTYAAYLGLLTLPEVFTNETGHFCLVVLDEFQNLEDMFGPHAFRDLGKKIMTQKRCLYVVASSFPALAERIINEKLSLLFGNFEAVHVDSFSYEESVRFIERNLEKTVLGSQLSSFLTDFTGGHPLYLDLLCRELYNLSAIHGQTEVYLPLLAQAVENTLFDRWGVISRHCELLIKDLYKGRENQWVGPLLISLANGHHKIETLMTDLKFTRYVLTQRLNRLVDQAVVIRNGTSYFVKDKLFRYWIKYVYQKRLRDVEFSNDKQKQAFREEFQRAVDHFKVHSRQDFPARIADLLHCFNNDSFDLNGRKYRLPVFNRIEPAKLRSANGTFMDSILAHSNEGTWLIAVKKENLMESDVANFLSGAKELTIKPKRCIFVSLTNLDEQARLKALQERCWVWNERELNTLLTVFDKPFIIR